MRDRSLIDEYLPEFDVFEHHQIVVKAPIEQVYTAVRELDISNARLSKILFRLRGLPSGSRIAMPDFLKMGFVLLGERPNEELLLGLVGQFWKPSGNLKRLEPEAFKTFDETGYAKTVWNFSLTETENGVLLETVTRVACMDDASRRRFRFYWTFIGPFSAFIRRDALKALKREAELAA